jgi:hypothetical protein
MELEIKSQLAKKAMEMQKLIAKATMEMEERWNIEIFYKLKFK